MEEIKEIEIKPSAGQSALFYGLVLSVAMIFTHLILFLADYHKSTNGFIIMLIVMTAGIVWASTDYRNKKWKGFISYGKAVKIGFLTVLFASIILACYTMIFHKYIDDSEVVRLRTVAKTEIQKMEDRDQMTKEDASKAAIWSDYMYSPVSFGIMSIFIYSFFGILIALITSIFIKKEESVRLQ